MLDVTKSQPATHTAQPPARRRRRYRRIGKALSGAMARLLVPLFILAIVAVLIGVAIGGWEKRMGQAAIQVTDDAYIRAEITRLSSQVAGQVQRIEISDFQQVKAGDVLVQIDPRDFKTQVAQAEATVNGARAALLNLENQIALQRATISQVEAQQVAATARELQSRQERERQEALLRTTFGTQQKVEQVVAQHEAAQADLKASAAAVQVQRRQLDVLSGNREQRAAEVAADEALLEAAKLRLSYTWIVAPTDGVVSERQVQRGDYVTIGSSLISVVPLPDVYIVANYKETQLTRVLPGQHVDISVDTFPGETFRGHVERISPASGSQFSLLPPDNATGNFTKVVQRIPVRIRLDVDDVARAKLRPGMSVTSRIDTVTPATDIAGR
ncbi:HlyD family secretion protein [Tardiphaga sp. OK246]|jgi:membrane fusion protein (multidrug efflux system)|uniref:HlyD family secretion protein n=1 Tax=Tardiphaga sp. OK246 TaxID=1855307 RepID=UPI001FCD7CD4|nr:HlyD family secretion protein [Tardiphaga sp. OK246]